MEPSENPLEENLRLRRTMRDLVALSTLPAVWIGLGPEGIARSLADVLFSTLSLDLVYVRLAGLTGEGVVEIVRSKHGPGPTDVEAVRAGLAPLLVAGRTEPPDAIPDPFGHGTLHAAVTRFGIGDDHGVLVTGSRSPEFPTEQDRLLLGVGANQTAIVLQRRRAEERLHEQQEWLQVTLASIGDAVIATDTEGHITFLNSVAEELSGWTRAEAQGKPLETVFAILHEHTRQPVENPVKKVLREGLVVGLGNHTVLLAKDGTERPIDDSAAPIRDATGKLIGVVLIFRDVSEQRRAEQHRDARLAVTQVLTQAATVQEAAAGVLRGVGESLGWDVGFFWTVNDDSSALDCRESWDRADVSVIEFTNESCRRSFRRGEGLPGRVWSGGQPTWILNVAEDVNFPRIASAVKYGLHSALACPVIVGDQTLGVIEFFAKRIREPDAGLLEMLATVAGYFGQFIERKLAEDQLRRRGEELADFFENATIGLHWVGPDGMILRVNQAELDLLGYSREEYVGRNIADFHAEENVICDILRRLQAGEKLRDYPAQLRCRDGSLKDVLIDSSVLWVNGEFVHTRCFTRDVTDRKRAEEAVRESEERFRELIEQAPFSVQIFAPDGRTVRVNPAWEELWGVRFDQIGAYNVLEDRQLETRGVLQFIHQAFAGQTAHIPAIQYNPNDTIPDITQHDDPCRWLSAVIYPLKDADEQVREVVLIHEDITERRRAEAALRESEERFRQLAENIEDVFWMADPREQRVLFISPAYERVWGRSRQGLYEESHAYLQAIHAEDRPRVLTAVDRQARGEATTEEYRITRPDGSVRWVLDRAFPIRDASGQVYRVAGIAEDVTERKRVEQDLKLQARVLESMTEGVSVSDENGIIVYTNPAEDSIFGYGRGELVGQHVSVQNTYPAEENQRIVAEVIEALNNEGAWSGEFSNRRKDGSEFTTYARITALETGGTHYFVCVQEDITERKRVQTELQDARSRLDAALEAGAIATWTWDIPSNRLVTDTHIARLFSLDPADTEGGLLDKYIQSIHPDDWPRVSAALSRSIESAEDYEADYRIVQPDGSARWVAARGRAERDETGRPVRMPGVLVDITDRKRLEQELRLRVEQLADADRRKDEFLATLAHELRNPLAPIRTGLEVMKLAKNDPATVEEIRGTMERQTQQLITLVDDLLDVSRITRGKLDLRKCRVKLLDVVQSAVEASEPFIDEAGHRLTVTIPEQSIYLDADPHRLAQVISNLLNNAAKYTPDGGQIWLSAEPKGSDVVVSVKDTGVGISPEMQDRIFEMFAQIDRPLEKVYTGLGIGLTLVKSLVEMHCGRIEVLSDGPNQGSEFRMRLPILIEMPPEERETGQAEEGAAVRNKRRVLVVDDNKAAADMLSMVVKLLGNEVRTASDGQQGIEVAAEFLPDMILMDLGMPRLNGYEAARHIRQQPWGEEMMLVALTGWGQDEDKQRTKEAGFNYHLVKPAEPSELQVLFAELDRTLAQ